MASVTRRAVVLLLCALLLATETRAERACSVAGLLSVVGLDAQQFDHFVIEVEDLATLAKDQIATWLERDWDVENRLHFSDLKKQRGFDLTEASCDNDPTGDLCQRFNQSMFQDATSGRDVEIWAPGWVQSHRYDHERVAHSVLEEGTSENDFVNAMVNDWCVEYDSSLTTYCAANFPGCPSDTLTNPRSPSEWLAQNGTLSGSGSKMCPKFCLQPAENENLLIDAELGYTQPVWTFFAQMFDKFSHIGAYWYWYGAESSSLVYAPSLEAFGGMGAFLPWDFMYPKIHRFGNVLNPEGKNVWTESYIDALSGNLMFSLAVPVYVGPKWMGVIGVDIVLAGMVRLFTGETGTPSGFMVVIDAEGHVMTAQQETYQLLFCPQYCVDGKFDLSADFEVETSQDMHEAGTGGASGMLLQATPGYRGSFGAVVQSSLIAQADASGAETATLCPEAQEGARAEDCEQRWWVVWQRLPSGTTPWTVVLVVPEEELEATAVWRAEPSVLSGVAHPGARGSMQLQTTIHNDGVAAVAWHVQRDVMHSGVEVFPLTGTLAQGETAQITIVVPDGRGLELSLTVVANGTAQTCFPALPVLVSTVLEQATSETVISDTWFMVSALALSVLIAAGVAYFVWRRGHKAMQVLVVMVTSTIPSVFGFGMEVIDLGSDIAACVLIWTTDLSVITESLRLGYVVAVAIGVVPSLFMLVTRMRSIIHETMGQSAEAVQRAESSGSEEDLTLTALVREEIDATEADLKRAMLASHYARSLLLVLVLEDVLMLVVNCITFGICYKDPAFIAHSLSNLLPISALSSALSVGYKFAQFQIWLTQHWQEQAQKKLKLDQLRDVAQLAGSSSGDGTNDTAIDFICVLTQAAHAFPGLTLTSLDPEKDRGSFKNRRARSAARNKQLSHRVQTLVHTPELADRLLKIRQQTPSALEDDDPAGSPRLPSAPAPVSRDITLVPLARPCLSASSSSTAAGHEGPRVEEEGITISVPVEPSIGAASAGEQWQVTDSGFVYPPVPAAARRSESPCFGPAEPEPVLLEAHNRRPPGSSPPEAPRLLRPPQPAAGGGGTALSRGMPQAHVGPTQWSPGQRQPVQYW